jgi:FKBP-type peptidyl-prolyl cis-trans isomerase SlyD
MKIIKNAVVALRYEVFDDQGEPIERGKEPLVYLHGGHAGIFPRVEQELAGKEEGDMVQVQLTPAEAFGERDDALVRDEPRSHFPEKVEVGMYFEAEMKHGEHAQPVVFQVVRVSGDSVTIDGNHPLAGRALDFRATVVSVRPATQEEIAHGHVHGAGGHHH